MVPLLVYWLDETVWLSYTGITGKQMAEGCTLMANNDYSSDEHKQEQCFLCTLDPRTHSCHSSLLTGTLLSAYDSKLDDERVCIFVLGEETQHIEIVLDYHYYHHLVQEIQARQEAIEHERLQLYVYHLPTAPVSVFYKGQEQQRYIGNTYTLAVLEPDILLNITDLNQASYCSRQYLLNRLVSSRPTSATIRGNLVHYCFKELLKEYSGKQAFSGATEQLEQRETSSQALERYLEEAIGLNRVELALAAIEEVQMREEVRPHLESLANWYDSERTTLWDLPEVQAEEQGAEGERTEDNQVRAETFLLAPEVGLRGRLDLYWKQAGRQRLLELKTGGAHGSLPKRDHRWQVDGYHMLLNVRRDSGMKKAMATLLYSGTPGSAQAIGIPSNIRDLQRVNETRAILLLNRVTQIPSAPPGVTRCSKCAMLTRCQTVSELLQWQPPVLEQQQQSERRDLFSFAAQQEVQQKTTAVHTQKPQIGADERVFFAHYYALLQREGRMGEQQMALLWQLSAEERIERGTALRGLAEESQAVKQDDGWVTTFRCDNHSELRDGDEVLLSDGNPIDGEVVTATILKISAERVTLWMREKIAHPQLIDRYGSDLVHVRTLQNLLRWQNVPAHLRDMVAGHVRPRFIEEHIAQRPDFNYEQHLAVERALQMQDYLLIQGPPGTGKTSVIAEITQRLVERGQRVLLAAFTNQAVDNMLKRLEREGFHEYVRLGHERNVSETVKPHLLQGQFFRAIERQSEVTDSEEEGGQGGQTQQNSVELVRALLQEAPVIASTTATWSADTYVPHMGDDSNDALDNEGFLFDVAIIDEAGQLTVPAILGALRFVKRFILVGDEKQLPPLVLSKEAAKDGLGRSLFSLLKEFDQGYMQNQPLVVSASVALRTQYRMNKWIAHFPSTVFYAGQLQPHTSVATQRLLYPKHDTLYREHPAISASLEPKWPLVFFDVQNSENRVENVVHEKASDDEAGAIRDIIASLLTRGIAAKDIGVIAPYRAQVATIRRRLFQDDAINNWQALPTDTPLTVDTVDRFQGGERLVIIISCATAQEPELSDPRREFLTDPRRLNVALTRAQRKLILVGNASALNQLPIFDRLLTYCRSMHTVFPFVPQREQIGV